MTEQPLRSGLHRSIFVKLVAIMLTTAACLVITVATIFWLLVVPSLNQSRRLIQEYTRVLATTSPDETTARRLASRLELQIRYEGPDGTWETAPGLPTIQEVRGYGETYNFFLATAPNGGSYLVVWQLGRRVHAAHTKMIWLLLFLVAGVVFTAYAVLARSLRPLRSLYDGVTRLREGHLDVVVHRRTRDEFGVLTEAFNRMVRRIGEMLRARDQLLLDVSHELRSPLTRMKVALALLPDSEQGERIAARMASDIAEMEAMITELLELERLREGRGIRAERQDLLPILRGAAESFADRPPGVRIAVPDAEILLDIDGERMRTVLRNLLENAIKYSLPESGPVEISIDQTAETVAVHVTDDGPGIPEADLASLFEPFFRVDRSRSKKRGGYGLGLSICKRILEAHGGSITVRNNPGRGATFTLTLPRSS